ncbi:MAG TPA: carboxypeptidase regulatory-like domain-containing protein [Pyrinomonadaceae bacterium]|nr:carboxypeptidase regulatory-like domain-containing protein [Pyrinomonadaceae bacterium]
MRYQVPVFTLLLLFSLTQTTAQEPQDKPMYFPTGNEANVTGTITVKGTVPAARLIDMSADPICQEQNRKPETESVITSQGRLQNAFIYVKGEKLGTYRFEIPEAEVLLNQRACYFEPHVFGLRVGQVLRIMNGDPTQHNVHPTPKLNQEWNQTQAANAPPMIKTFKRAEVMIPIKCNQHPWMKAYAGVMDHPFFAVSDRLGKFEIHGLPEGTYKVVVWHEVLGEQEMEITVVPGESRSVDFTFDSEKKP